MSQVTVRIPTPLRSFANGKDEVTVEGSTIREALQNLGESCDGLLDRVLTPEGEARHFVNIFLGADNMSALQGLETPVSDGDILSIIPAVAGGS